MTRKYPSPGMKRRRKPQPTGPTLTTPGTGVLDTMTHRARLATSACPELLIDTDGWALPSQVAYRSWTSAQAGLGVPSLYYTVRLDVPDPSEQPIPPASLHATAQHRAAPGSTGQPTGPR